MLIANLLGICVLFYVFWKKLKDDYHYEKIFNLAIVILISFLLGLFILNFVDQSFSFWLILASIITGFGIVINRQKMKFFETVDALIIASLPWLAFVYLHDTSKNLSLSSFVSFWFTLICIFIYFYVSSAYKTFNWYKSGRIGISGIMTGIVFFVLRMCSAIFMPDTLYIIKNYEIYLSLSGALLFFVLLYNLKR